VQAGQKLQGTLEQISLEIRALGWGNGINPAGMGAIESMTLELRKRLDRIANQVERIADALEKLAPPDVQD
jgi:hypothetical protein